MELGTSFFHNVSKIEQSIGIAASLYLTTGENGTIEITLFGLQDADRAAIRAAFPFQPNGGSDVSLALHVTGPMTINDIGDAVRFEGALGCAHFIAFKAKERNAA